jgi:molybdate transport system ATP-binding protein
MIDIALDHRRAGFHLTVDVSCRSGITALFGRSGAGKSSVVAMVAGLSRPDAGRIAIDDQVLFDSARGINLSPERRRIGVVFQDGRLFPHLSVLANLRFGEGRAPAGGRRGEMDKVVGLLGIEPLLHRRPPSLSGGEKQRVAIGRALLSGPRMLLMDEPLAALDGARKAELLPFIQSLSSEFALPIVYVSHAIEEIIQLADDMVVLESGAVLAFGPLEQVLSDIDLSSISGRSDVGALLSAVVDEHLPEFGLTRLRLGDNHLTVPLQDAPAGTPVRVRIGAQDVALAIDPPGRTSFQNVLTGTVLSIRPDALGQIDVRVEVSGVLWTKITQPALAHLDLRLGDRVFAMIKSVAIARAAVALRPPHREVRS